MIQPTVRITGGPLARDIKVYLMTNGEEEQDITRSIRSISFSDISFDTVLSVNLEFIAAKIDLMADLTTKYEID